MTISTEQVQELYDIAVRCEFARIHNEGDDEVQDVSLALLSEMERHGGIGSTTRKLIDMFRASERELLAIREAQPVFFIEIEGDDWIDEVLTAMEEVLRISDRDHEAWNRAKTAISNCRAATPQSYGNSEQLKSEVMICDMCGHDALLEKNGWYTCDQQHSFQVRSEPVREPYKLGGWISCSERMPVEQDENGRYMFVEALVTDGYAVFISSCTTERLSNGKLNQYWDCLETNVTHWMPLPLGPLEKR